MLTPEIKLVPVPGVPDSGTNCWKVRALSIGGRSPAITALADWEQNEKSDYKKIIHALAVAAQKTQVLLPKLVKKCANRSNGEIFEARADKLNARLMFFYSTKHKTIVLTNGMWKDTDNQDSAFRQCGQMKVLFEKHYAPEK